MAQATVLGAETENVRIVPRLKKGLAVKLVDGE
jgi:hypothetical protein